MCEAKAALMVCWYIFKKPYVKEVIRIPKLGDTANSNTTYYGAIIDDEDDSDVFNKRQYRNTFCEKKNSITVDRNDSQDIDYNYDRSLIEENASFAGKIFNLK